MSARLSMRTGPYFISIRRAEDSSFAVLSLLPFRRKNQYASQAHTSHRCLPLIALRIPGSNTQASVSGGLADVQPRPFRHTVFPAHPDHNEECRKADFRVDLSPPV